jgi:hypothetical protein
VRAILAGERDPKHLAELSDYRIHGSREDITKSLEGVPCALRYCGARIRVRIRTGLLNFLQGAWTAMVH